jgi:hypothetical protein
MSTLRYRGKTPLAPPPLARPIDYDENKYKKPPPKTEQEQRLALFGDRARSDRGDIAEIKRKVDFMAQQQNEGASKLDALLEGQQEAIDLGRNIARVQDVQTGMLGTITNVTKTTLKRADEILKVSKSIKEDTEKLKRAYASGGAGSLIKEVIFNERLLLVTYFFIHPLAPITTETLLSAWTVPLGLYRLYRGIFHRETDVIISASPGAVLYNFTLSQPALIGLMYQIVSIHVDMRMLDPEMYRELFSGSLENAGLGIVNFMTGLARGDNAVAGLPEGFTTTDLAGQLGRYMDSIPGLWQTIETTCPTLATNKAKFNLCFAQFALGKLTTATGYVFSFPGYAAQLNHFVTGEGQMLGMLLQFVGTLLSYVAGGAKDKLAEMFSIAKERAAAETACVLYKATMGLAGKCKIGGGRKKLRGGEQLQLQMLQQRDIQVAKMSRDTQLRLMVQMQVSAFMLDTYEIAEEFTKGKLKVVPQLRYALETNIEVSVLFLSSPTLVDNPVLMPEDIQLSMKENAFQLFRNPTLMGGKKIRRKTRRSMVKLRSTRKRR